MHRVGGVLLERVFVLDTGHRGQQIDSDGEHQAKVVDYRSKHPRTVLALSGCDVPTGTAQSAAGA